MMQTVLVRAADFLKGLLPLADKPAYEMPRKTAVQEREDEHLESEGRFSRDEAWYWAMHAHW